MEISNQTPAPSKAFQLMSGMMNTQVLIALIKSNVFEAIGKEKKSIAEIATTCNVNVNVLSRTLRFGVSVGLVDKIDNLYSLNEVGQCFLKDVPGSFYDSASYFNAPPIRDSWQNFLFSLQTGKPAFDPVFGTSYFEYLSSNEEFGTSFNKTETERSAQQASSITEAYDFSIFSTICDVGGGQGMLLKSILEKNPTAKGILYDLPSAVKGHVLNEGSKNVEISGGNFFDRVPEADCIILKAVIHNWSDDNSRKILSNCRKSLKQGGKLLVIEFVVEEPINPFMVFADLHMQVMIGGAERTEKEFARVLESAGFKLNQVISTKSNMQIIEAI